MENGDDIIQIIAKTPIHPTEDREKVEQCFLNILDNPNIEEEKSYLIVKSTEMSTLSPIRKKLKQQRIRNSARKILLNDMEPNKILFYLNKQAAFMGRIHFVTNLEQEDYLGPITIIIEAEEERIKEIINWLTMVDFEIT